MSNRTIIIILMVGLAMAIIWRDQFSGRGNPEWTHCKESLFEQVIFNSCTLIYEGEEKPA